MSDHETGDKLAQRLFSNARERLQRSGNTIIAAEREKALAEVSLDSAEAISLRLASATHALRETRYAIAESSNRLIVALDSATRAIDGVSASSSDSINRASQQSSETSAILAFWTKIMVVAIGLQALVALADLFKIR